MRQSKLAIFLWVLTLLTHPRPLLSLPVEAPVSCVKFLSALNRTLGVEVEMGAFLELLRRRPVDREVALRELLNASRVSALYGFYGRNRRGEWVQDLIPRPLAQTENFQHLFAQHPSWFAYREGDWYIRDWAKRRDIAAVLYAVLNARGVGETNLLLRRIEDHWQDGAHPMDRLLPLELAEEWENVNGVWQFQMLEFPMNGSVRTLSDARQFLQHLGHRLGLIPGDRIRPNESPVLSGLPVHIHWVPMISSLPNITASEREIRRQLFDSTIAYWGDANDHRIVSALSAISLGEPPVSEMTFDSAFVRLVRDHLRGAFSNISIQPMFRSEYLAVRATPDGIIVRNRQSGLRPEADINFPPYMKFSPVGMRGIYDGIHHRGRAPVPIIGLEFRLETTLDNSTAVMPPVHSQTSEVDMTRLLEHATGAARGLETDPAALRQRAQVLGIDPRVVFQTQQAVRRAFPNEPWGEESQMSYVLLPFNAWLNHPLVQSNLNKMDSQRRGRSVERFRQARDRYVERVNLLAAAFRDPSIAYPLPWTDAQQVTGGVRNPFHSHASPQVSALGFSSPQELYLPCMAAEAMRFVTETNLVNLTRLH